MKVYTVQQVADIMSVKPRTVMEWLKNGKLRGLKLSDNPKSEWRIPEHMLNAFIENRLETTKQFMAEFGVSENEDDNQGGNEA